MYHPMQDELPITMIKPFTGDVVTWENGEIVSDRNTDFSWLEDAAGPEVFMKPWELEEYALVTSEARLWEETEAELDDWSPKKRLPQWFVDDVARDINAETQGKLRKSFWLWFNGQKSLFTEALQRADLHSVHQIYIRMSLFDLAIEEYNDNHHLFRDLPSFIGELLREIEMAEDRDFTIKPIEQKIAMGEMVKIKINGITNIVPADIVEEMGLTHLIIQ